MRERSSDIGSLLLFSNLLMFSLKMTRRGSEIHSRWIIDNFKQRMTEAVKTEPPSHIESDFDPADGWQLYFEPTVSPTPAFLKSNQPADLTSPSCAPTQSLQEGLTGNQFAPLR